jgi:hypothetical protein
MIVMMKRNVVPLCDHHHVPMQLMQFGASNVALTLVAHKCTANSCTRAYLHGHGYIDIADSVSFADALRRDCPEDDMTMYLAEIDDNGNELWRCGQVHCQYSELVNPHERFRVLVNPVDAQSHDPEEHKPYAQLRAVGASSGTTWIGPCQPWHVTAVTLCSFGQNPAQVAAIRDSLLKGIPAELAGVAAPLGVTEQQVVKGGLKRVRPPNGSSSALAS